MNQENLNNNQEITEAKTTDVALTSSMFAEDAGSGLENVTSEDMAIPRLKILQALSPEVNKRDGGGLVAQHDDVSILDKTTKNNFGQDALPNGNYIQTSATHFLLVVNQDGSFDQAMLAMAGTQLKKSRTWNSMMASITSGGALSKDEMMYYEAAKNFAVSVSGMSFGGTAEESSTEAPF